MIEKWENIKGYEGYYQVSNLGNIRTVERKITSGLHNTEKYTKKSRIKKLQIGSQGYKIVRLTVDKKGKTYRVHRLVAKAFIPNPDNKPCINHKDTNKQNNHIDNIEWCTYKENAQHASANGLLNRINIKGTEIEMLSLKGEFIKSFDSIIKAKKYLNKSLKSGNITEVCQGKRKQAYGYKWRYVNE